MYFKKQQWFLRREMTENLRNTIKVFKKNNKFVNCYFICGTANEPKPLPINKLQLAIESCFKDFPILFIT